MSSDGWKIIDNPGICFIRSKGMLPLPYPADKGNITLLKKYVNVKTEGDFVLITACILGAYRPIGAIPLLILLGEPGTAKTSTAEFIRSLIDPHKSLVRAFPENIEALYIAGKHSYVLAYDNLSGIPRWGSDALCMLSTGGGFSKRKLYSNAEEVFIDLRRFVILNGNDLSALKPDLLDRAVIIECPPISPSARIGKKTLQKDFEKDSPMIFRAILDALVEGLRNENKVVLRETPRMADFTKWCVACEPALWEKGKFLQTYLDNKSEASESLLSQEPLAQILMELLDDERREWTMNASQWLRTIEQHVSGSTLYGSSFVKNIPDSPAAFSRRLRRLAPYLRGKGYHVEWGRDDKGRFIRIRREDISCNTPIEKGSILTELF